MLEHLISVSVFIIFLINTLALIHYVFLCLRDGVAQAYGPIGSDEFAIFRDERPNAFFAFVGAFSAIAAAMGWISYDSLMRLIG
ncbi:hypothetical protein [Blastochloris viridis]|uniref:Uncharacterized protein n=1 Tax=Blastochloris viridis TaxID=1079 RepID=A0A0H5BET7_BLAVI|nr:hypothetical protein [Blastochloris viridis]ALK07881.1 hypothetical protein BVIR_64 [Blastochloris viridis]BAR98871.1 hypothetical protein BV133_1278 [Blastochloris viridis]CUU43803.1 hypothetical protein BVIRIDIS_28300 [Blastochloris viridis]